jgi:hypothetical protein
MSEKAYLACRGQDRPDDGGSRRRRGKISGLDRPGNGPLPMHRVRFSARATESLDEARLVDDGFGTICSA